MTLQKQRDSRPKSCEPLSRCVSAHTHARAYVRTDERTTMYAMTTNALTVGGVAVKTHAGTSGVSMRCDATNDDALDAFLEGFS